MPDVEYSYYLAKSNSVVTVTQTIDCNSAKTDFIIANTPAVTTAYASDFSKEPVRIRIKNVEGAFALFADSDMGFTFYDDGRLKSVNQSTTGEGEAIIKSAASIVSAFAPLGAGDAGGKKPDITSDCKAIASWGGGKPVTIIYSNGIDLGTASGSLANLKPAAGSEDLHAALTHLPPLQATIGKPQPVVSRARYVPGSLSEDMFAVTLQETELVQVDVLWKGGAFWTTNVIVPGSKTYDLPIPKSALFGKQSFALALSEAGAVNSIDYGKTAGTAGALNSAGAIATTLEPSAATKAATLKAQADLIAQQTRLVNCRAHPDKCT